MIRYMLDTNIIIYTLKNKPTVVREKFERIEGLQLANWVDGCVQVVFFCKPVFYNFFRRDK